MLRKLMWSVLLGLTIFLARRAAARIWRTTTGEEPPVRTA
jgi:hypothetical protein